MDKKAIIETLKSAGRFVWFGLLSLVVVALGAIITDVNVVSAVIDLHGLKISVGAVLVAVLGYLIKLIDTYIHNNKKIDSNGLAPNFLQK
jgi:hypothetical protein